MERSLGKLPLLPQVRGQLCSGLQISARPTQKLKQKCPISGTLFPWCNSLRVYERPTLLAYAIYDAPSDWVAGFISAAFRWTSNMHAPDLQTGRDSLTLLWTR